MNNAPISGGSGLYNDSRPILYPEFVIHFERIVLRHGRPKQCFTKWLSSGPRQFKRIGTYSNNTNLHLIMNDDDAL